MNNRARPSTPKPSKSHASKRPEKPENKLIRLRHAERREDKLFGRRLDGCSSALKFKQQARTEVYKIIYGDAKTGLGTNSPACDSRKKPRYSKDQHRGLSFDLRELLKNCKFTDEQVIVLQSHFNALRPNSAPPAVLMSYPSIIIDEPTSDIFLAESYEAEVA